jgi:hypothetical protein
LRQNSQIVFLPLKADGFKAQVHHVNLIFGFLNILAAVFTYRLVLPLASRCWLLARSQ